MSRPDMSFGELITTWLDGGRELRIEKAPPRVRISALLVRQAQGRNVYGWWPPCCELTGDRLVINAVNGRLVYRIGAYHPGPGAGWYEAEWPD